MSETLTLSAELRERAGKGASRALRREGRTPAVVYGGNQEPVAIHLEEKELARALGTGHFFNSIVELTIGGQTVRTLAKDVAFHAVTDRPQHADFLRLAANAEVHVNVPVVFQNEEAPGIKAGGVLNVVRHELELVCVADAIPDDIIVDLSGLEVGDSVHISP
jgi:large subunit ribosomal protein L25